MSRFRARAACAAVVIAGGLVLTLRGQVDDARLQILQNVGLPAIDEGLVQDDSHTPSSFEARRRAAFRASLMAADRVSASGTPYRAGRLIVKFREQSAMTQRRAAVQAASRTGEIAERPSYADFDVVRIDADEDAADAARALREQPDVEYAQVAHRFHTLL